MLMSLVILSELTSSQLMVMLRVLQLTRPQQVGHEIVYIKQEMRLKPAALLRRSDDGDPRWDNCSNLV